MKVHDLKTWPAYFRAIRAGIKKFEVRKNDRDFDVGDTLVLREWNPAKEEYTGKEEWFRVDYIIHGLGLGIEEGFCVMSISKQEP